MAILQNRPLFCAALLYIICAYLGYFSDFRNKVFLCAVGLLALVAYLLLCLLRKLSRKQMLTCGLCVAAAVLSLSASLVYFGPMQQKYEEYADREQLSIEATVLERSVSSEITVLRVRVQQLDGEREHFDAQLVCGFTSYLQPGHVIKARVTPTVYPEQGDDYYNKTQALADGLCMELTCEDEDALEVTGENDTLPYIALHRLNNRLCGRLVSLCGKEAGGLAAALLLGNKSWLDLTTARDFSRAGASHMLALSGMHVSILIGALGWLLSGLRIHRRARAVFLVAASVAYLLLIGLSISATRAVVMVCVLQLSYLLAADNDTLTTLSLTGAGLLLLSPATVCDVGFCLSFLATFGIVVLVPPLHRGLQALGKRIAQPPHMMLKKRLGGMLFSFAEAVLVGVIACFAIAVPSCYMLGNTSLFSPLTTALLSPLMTAILICAAIALIFSPIPYLGDFFATLVRLFCRLTTTYTARIGEVDGALLPLTHKAVQVLCIVFCLAMLILLVLQLGRRRWLLMLPPCLLVLSLCVFYPLHTVYTAHQLRAVYTHASYRAETLVTAQGYRAYVLDLSTGSSAAVSSAVGAASELHATEIAAVVMTDLQPSHGAALTRMFSSYKTDAIYLPTGLEGKDADTRVHLCEIAARHGVLVIDYEYGQPIELYDGTVLTVYKTDLARSEQPVLVATLERGDACITLLNAAAQYSSLAGIADKSAARADVLICPDRGPVPRTTFSPAVSDGAQVVFASERVAAYCDPHSVQNAEKLILCPNSLEICLASDPET